MPGGGEMPKSQQTPKEKVCLICIDGWGVSPAKDPKGDAIRNAQTPVMSKFEKEYPYETIAAHGLSVGLPDGLMGNSEVGHLNIGAGRVVYQDIVRIDLANKNKEFGKIENIKGAFERAKSGNGRLHLLGLVSDGGVHAHIDHLISLIRAAKEAGVPETYIHFFGDGRDTSPKSATKYLKQLQDAIKEIGYGKIATIVGRYYAMDRDKRWERIKIAFDALTQADKGEKSDDAVKTVESRYDAGETDEFLKPIVLNEEGRIKDGDTMFFFNFRSDRMREITQAFGISPCPFDATVPKDTEIFTMTQYKGDFPFKVAFPAQTMDNVLAEWLAKNGIPQMHVAETEKYAHVTFFFNGGTEAQFDKEDRALVPSPKVATYDLKPEMSAKEVGEKVVENIESGKYPFVMCNFAPPDMVGHTGVYEAAIKGVEATDAAIGAVYEACKKNGYILFVTADHGNAEKMLSDDYKSPHTAHTCSPVPFVMTSNKYKYIKDAKGCLADVAPTILRVMGIDIPQEMTGHSLLEEKN
ncbi:2,3-bisphosphoglycerate-independent phosphoglycerate mutase [Radiomyces spectabilis]|uniref:2,3-bisphosphoglycerate-independent phosphoglycerate mutase n=1 Tax=Radiomyces spectabilis TaxID=64574 RepID=UPI002220F960|nr:2,3-bisphosphoglycerate-independent phosphoglycerate mutase [Radiomyces spectabilis]KAI8379179.1 2,3-bisphosphoglycerate-independent phosphoglycerate mutase [Radiomyces spectabilis]